MVIGHRDKQSWCTNIGLESLGSTFPDNLSVIDNGNAISELVSFFQILRRQQHSGAVVVEATDFFPQRHTAHRVKTGCRFVKKEHAGFMDECERKI